MKERTMAYKNDWLPTTRVGQIAMAKRWKTVLDTYGVSWRITPAEIAELGDLTQDAESALAKVLDKALRNHVDTVHCNEVFKKVIIRLRCSVEHMCNSVSVEERHTVQDEGSQF
jgi:hypothetical protein